MKSMSVIILIDDEVEYCQTLQRNAKLKDLEIRYFTNYDEGFKFIESEPDSFSGVILDARCYKNKIAESDKETKDSGIFYAVNWVKEHIQKKGSPVPVCVNTGFSAGFRENLEQMEIMVFDKFSDRDKMLDWLLDEIEKMPETKIKKDFPDVFETFRAGYLDSNTEKTLITILQIFENPPEKNIEEFLFNPVRQILEAVYKQLHKSKNEIIPFAALNYERNRVNLTWCQMRLARGTAYIDQKTQKEVCKSIDPVLPEHLGTILYSLTAVTQARSHHYNEFRSRYLIKAIVYQLLEFIIWYKHFIKHTMQ